MKNLKQEIEHKRKQMENKYLQYQESKCKYEDVVIISQELDSLLSIYIKKRS